MYNWKLTRAIEYLMTADQEYVYFKVNTLIIKNLKDDQVHILNWLLLKSPNLTDLQIEADFYKNETFNRPLEI
jgi:hypothetical protein